MSVISEIREIPIRLPINLFRVIYISDFLIKIGQKILYPLKY